MKHRSAAAAAALLIMGAGICAVGTDAGAVGTKANISASFRKKYKSILANEKEFQGVYIGDLIGDERDELVVAYNDLGMLDIYTPVGKSLKKYSFNVMSVWGFTKYIKPDREIICMNYYGHTEGAPYPLSMETYSVENDAVSHYNISRDYDGKEVICTTNGKKVSDKDFAVSLNLMIAQTARSEYIPLVKYGDDDLQWYEGEIMDIAYFEYIKNKLE